MARPELHGMGPWRSSEPPADFVPFPASAVERSVLERLLDVAADHPDAVALSAPAGAWTYAELVDEVRRRGGALRRSVDRDTATPVAVLAEHDGPLVVAILSVIAAGHIVVVLDPTSPSNVIDDVLDESGATVVLHDVAFADPARAIAARSDGRRAVALSDLVGEPVDPAAADPASPLMLAFTSGTSGRPKGAVITHGVILNLVRGATNALGIAPTDCMPMLFPVSLAVAAYPMFLPLLNGGKLATLDVRGVGLAPIPEFLIDEGVTVAYMAPTVIRFLVDAVAGFEFPAMRMVALGGEPVDAEVVRLTTDLLGPDLVVNGFGTTETGVIALYVIDPDRTFDGVTPSGYPVPDVEFHVLDDEGHSVPQGESGEVAVSSPHVFLGYWGHAELSRNVLAPDPGGRDGWQLYRTGDLGRLDEHGALIVLGRLDTKVKVRGRFVVLGDVESELHELAGLTDAAVVATRHRDQVELCAVVVAGADEVGRLDTAALRLQLLERHEAYRVPSRWVVVDELPRLPNGKVDRQGLSALAGAAGAPADPGATEPSGTPTDEAPPDAWRLAAVQRELRDLWELLLPVGVVGIDDDFVALGGDSLLTAQMLVMAEERLGVIVPMGEMIHARTVRDLARVVVAIERQVAVTSVACVNEGDPDNRPRLWFFPDLQGSAYRVRHLAEHLGPDQPLWSFESPLLAGEANRFSSLDELVAHFVADLLRSQPSGPYWLGGYSFGGICAFEAARQLRRAGHEVVLLAIVDVGPSYRGPNWSERRVPFRPWFGVEKPPPQGSSWSTNIAHYRDMIGRSPLGAARHVTVRSGLYRFVDPARFKVDLVRRGRVRPAWRLWYAWEEHWRLSVRSWDRTRTYDGRVDLLWASQTGATDNSMGWGPLVGDLCIHRFEGFHDDLLEDRGAPALAVELRSVLDERLAAG